MALFPCGHAAHPHWRMAAALVLAQLRAQLAQPQYAQAPTLGLLYITDSYVPVATDILDWLAAELPEVTDWAGTAGIGIAASGVEYVDQGALAVMLCALPADQYRVFSGVAPLAPGFAAASALVHADPHAPDVAALVQELAARTRSRYLFGGLSSGRGRSVQFAVSGNGNLPGHGGASGVFHGGLSGVAWGSEVALLSRVSQGCQPLGPVRQVTRVEGNVLLELDSQPALEVLLHDLGCLQAAPQDMLAAVRNTLVGLLQPAGSAGPILVGRSGHFGSDALVRHIIGLDPARQGVAVAEYPELGMQLAFCQRNRQAARADLVRICAEIREELEPEAVSAELLAGLDAAALASVAHPVRRIAGAVYVSCTGRGGQHFGAPSAELQLVRHALGEVPLVGFFAAGEIAGQQLYGYTGVLTVFTTQP